MNTIKMLSISLLISVPLMANVDPKAVSEKSLAHAGSRDGRRDMILERIAEMRQAGAERKQSAEKVTPVTQQKSAALAQPKAPAVAQKVATAAPQASAPTAQPKAPVAAQVNKPVSVPVVAQKKVTVAQDKAQTKVDLGDQQTKINRAIALALQKLTQARQKALAVAQSKK